MSSIMSSAPVAGAIEQRVARGLWWLFSLALVGYAVLAFDYFISFAAGRESLWLQLFLTLVSSEHALGEGSVHVDQLQAYTRGLNFMLMHTMMGAFCMAIGPFQFMHGLRRRYPVAHRAGGKIYLGTVTLSMVGGLGYLAVTPMQEVYSGAAFASGLVALDLLVLLTAWLAYRAVRQRDFQRHQAWMAYNYGLLLTTPILRLLWILFGLWFPGMTQAEGNIAITTFLLPLSLVVMLIWLARQRGTAGMRPA